MRQDARKLDHKTLEELRIRGVKQVQSGVSPEEVTRVLGLSRSTVYNWLAQYREYGMHGLKAKKIRGRPPKIDGKKMKWIYDTIVQKSPLQFKFEFALWTREMIQKIIFDKFRIKLGLSSVSRLLKQLGLTCQRPIFKAWQQNSQQVNNWLKKVLPCYCKLKSATWQAPVTIYIESDPNAYIYTIQSMDQLLQHEIVHATTDEKLAPAAFGEPIGFLETHCLFRWQHRQWTRKKCMQAQQAEADKVASWVKDKADGFLADIAHTFIGTYATTFNPAGIPPYYAWLDTWLDRRFPGYPYYEFWRQ